MDVVGRGRGEEHECAGHVVRLTPATGGDPLEDLPRSRLVLPQRAGVVGRDLARRDRVDVHAVGSPLVGERLRQLRDPALAGGVAGDGDAALEREHRGDEDDLAAAVLDHPPAELAGEHELGA